MLIRLYCILIVIAVNFVAGCHSVDGNYYSAACNLYCFAPYDPMNPAMTEADLIESGQCTRGVKINLNDIRIESKIDHDVDVRFLIVFKNSRYSFSSDCRYGYVNGVCCEYENRTRTLINAIVRKPIK